MPMNVVIVACTVTEPVVVTLMFTGQLLTPEQLLEPTNEAPAVSLSRLQTTSNGF